MSDIERLFPQGKGWLPSWPSVVLGHDQEPLDFARLVVPYPDDTDFLRVSGDGWAREGVMDGSYLVVDCREERVEGSLVVAYAEEGLLLGRLRRLRGRPVLAMDDPEASPLELGEDWPWGVATWAVTRLRRR